MAMDNKSRARELTLFLLGREPSAEEQARFDSLGFDCDRYLIQLLCSDEATELYGDITQYLIDHVRSETTFNTMQHKMAHDLVLLQEELGGLQQRLDRLNDQMIQLLKQEDRIAGLFDSINRIQAEFNQARGKLEQIEADLREQPVRVYHDN